MKGSLANLKLLVNLAWVDGNITDIERQYIFHIGKANGVQEKMIEKLLNDPPHDVDFETLSDQEKNDILTSLVSLMKLDSKLFGPEIRYCTSIAEKMGFESDSIHKLLYS